MGIDWSTIRHFRREEWSRDPDQVDQDLVRLLDAVREAAGVPIVVHVAYDPSGHSPNSRHHVTPDRPLADAVDFHFAPRPGGRLLSHREEYALLTAHHFGGIGFYPDWLPRPGWHVDMRPWPGTVWVCVGGAYRYGHDMMAEALSNANNIKEI